MSRLIYLASPYSHPDPEVRQQRFEAVCQAAATLVERGHLIFCPIAHGHAIAQAGNLEPHWKRWEALDSLVIKRSDELWILPLEGWDRSVGIQAEIATARFCSLDIFVLGENLEVERRL